MPRKSSKKGISSSLNKNINLGTVVIVLLLVITGVWFLLNMANQTQYGADAKKGGDICQAGDDKCSGKPVGSEKGSYTCQYAGLNKKNKVICNAVTAKSKAADPTPTPGYGLTYPGPKCNVGETAGPTKEYNKNISFEGAKQCQKDNKLMVQCPQGYAFYRYSPKQYKCESSAKTQCSTFKWYNDSQGTRVDMTALKYTANTTVIGAQSCWESTNLVYFCAKGSVGPTTTTVNGVDQIKYTCN